MKQMTFAEVPIGQVFMVGDKVFRKNSPTQTEEGEVNADNLDDELWFFEGVDEVEVF